MKSQLAIGFIGAGNMGAALIRGVLDAHITSPQRVWAADVAAEKLSALKDDLHIQITESNPEILKHCNVVVLAVKPQNMGDVLSEIASTARADHLFISIAAGIPTARIETALGSKPRVVRVMPNTPALIKCGASALARGRYATEDDLTFAVRMFQAVGVAVTLDESLLDLVTGLTGSGPAYIFLMIESLIKAGIELGLKQEDADQLVKQMVLGAARMASELPQTPAQLREAVTSPGGTTFAGLQVLDKAKFRDVISAAVKRATERAKELAQS
jgi:pyrroline-5-carboxylate reductase